MTLTRTTAGTALTKFAYAKVLALNTSATGANIGALSDFPICVAVNSSSWPNATERGHFFSDSYNPLGKRVQFFDADGTTNLAYEVESYDTATQTAVYWVKKPAVASNSTTDHIHVGYGSDPNAANQDAATSVWDANFKAVYHLNGTTGTGDSTGVNTLDVVSGVVDYAGLVGKSLDFDGVNDRCQAPDSATLQMDGVTQFCIGVFVNIDTLPASNTFADILNRYNVDGTGKSAGYNLRLHNNTGTQSLDFCWNTHQPSPLVYVGQEIDYVGSLATGTPMWLVGWWDGANQRVYQNGAQLATSALSATSPYAKHLAGSDVAKKLNIGNFGLYNGTELGRYFDGKIGEVRISAAARSVYWQTAEYFSMKATSFSGDGWLTLGSEGVSNLIAVTSLPTGYYARLTDGTHFDDAAASSGTATITPSAAQLFGPWTLRIYNGNPTGAGVQQGSDQTGVYGGDSWAGSGFSTMVAVVVADATADASGATLAAQVAGAVAESTADAPAGVVGTATAAAPVVVADGTADALTAAVTVGVTVPVSEATADALTVAATFATSVAVPTADSTADASAVTALAAVGAMVAEASADAPADVAATSAADVWTAVPVAEASADAPAPVPVANAAASVIVSDATADALPVTVAFVAAEVNVTVEVPCAEGTADALGATIAAAANAATGEATSDSPAGITTTANAAASVPSADATADAPIVTLAVMVDAAYADMLADVLTVSVDAWITAKVASATADAFGATATTDYGHPKAHVTAHMETLHRSSHLHSDDLLDAHMHTARLITRR